MLFLNCGHQNYEWGRFSSVSLVFKIQNSNPNLLDSLDMKARYAELWIGTHINLPSFLQKYPSQSLADFLQKTPELLGETVKSFDNTAKLPFIMKILSVGKSLSIQAHPDKELAFKLNSSNPEIYKDANHKPEIAIALTKFEALCNFAPFTKILENFKNYQEFEELFPKELLTKFIEFQSKESLQKMVKSLFHTPKDLISQNIEKMIIRLTKKGSLTERDNLIMRLHEQFPFDIGVFFSLFMNYTVLSPGECLIMKPNEPHAYLDGECIECMANSDNVVRAGLTPKLKDIDTLCSMLTYEMGGPHLINPVILKSKERDNYECYVYKSEFREFHCVRLEMQKATESDAFYSPFPFLGIVLEGSGNYSSDEIVIEIKEFQQFFIQANTKFMFSTHNKLKLYLCGSW